MHNVHPVKSTRSILYDKKDHIGPRPLIALRVHISLELQITLSSVTNMWKLPAPSRPHPMLTPCRNLLAVHSLKSSRRRSQAHAGRHQLHSFDALAGNAAERAPDCCWWVILDPPEPARSCLPTIIFPSAMTYKQSNKQLTFAALQLLQETKQSSLGWTVGSHTPFPTFLSFLVENCRSTACLLHRLSWQIQYQKPRSQHLFW